MENEVWVPIKNYENFYEISNFGRIKGLERTVKGRPNCLPFIRKEIFIKPVLKKIGYYVFSVMVDGIKEQLFIHRVIAECFIPNPENKREVNHINGIKTDNRIENLEWATRKENANHAFSTGLMHPHSGATHYKSKGVLNLSTGIYYGTAKEAAKSAGISMTHFNYMLRGRRNNTTPFILVA